jgi:hypothetical protein
MDGDAKLSSHASHRLNFLLSIFWKHAAYKRKMTPPMLPVISNVTLLQRAGDIRGRKPEIIEHGDHGR